jgi:hypothetical protein
MRAEFGDFANALLRINVSCVVDSPAPLRGGKVNSDKDRCRKKRQEELHDIVLPMAFVAGLTKGRHLVVVGKRIPTTKGDTSNALKPFITRRLFRKNRKLLTGASSRFAFPCATTSVEKVAFGNTAMGHNLHFVFTLNEKRKVCTQCGAKKPTRRILGAKLGTGLPGWLQCAYNAGDGLQRL